MPAITGLSFMLGHHIYIQHTKTIT